MNEKQIKRQAQDAPGSKKRQPPAKRETGHSIEFILEIPARAWNFLSLISKMD